MPGPPPRRQPLSGEYAPLVPAARLRRHLLLSWIRVRRRFGWLDHLARAGHRFGQVSGRRLAAAVTYYRFFAAFALVLLGLAVVGYVIDDPAVESSVEDYLAGDLPSLALDALREARSAVGLAASVTLLVIGLLWVDALRSSIRAIWQIDEYPGRFLLRWTIELLALLGLGLL